MTENKKVAYFIWHFPRLTETFILREMLSLREVGIDIQVFAFMRPVPSATMHPQVERMMPYVHYSPFLFSQKLILAQFYFLFHSPLKYFQTLWMAIWQTHLELADLGKILLIFPKTVYFAKQLQEMKIDHIHAHFVAMAGIAAQIASNLTGIPFSLHAHAYDIFQRNQECVRRQLSLAGGVVTISEYHRLYISNLCPRWRPEEIPIIHCGLDTDEFVPDHIHTTDQVTRIISVGSLIEKKGHKYLIEACNLLASKGYNFICSIIGNGPLYYDLQSQINKYGLQDRILLLGAKNQTQVKDQYRQSDIFVLACTVARSGDKDGIPVALMEAMSMQIPVISTQVSGIPELIANGETGLLVPERDSIALAQAIELLINNQSLRRELGMQGRQSILAGFEIHHTSAQMASFFENFHNPSKTV